MCVRACVCACVGMCVCMRVCVHVCAAHTHECVPVMQGGNFHLKVGGAHEVSYIMCVNVCGLEYFTLD